MFIYLCGQGCPLLTQIKQKNGRSKAISQATLPVLKWTICSKVYNTRVVLAIRQLSHFCNLSMIRQYTFLVWKGYVCCYPVIKHKKGTNVILLCHTKSAILSYIAFGLWGSCFWQSDNVHEHLKQCGEKPLKKNSRTHCANCHVKIQVKTIDLTVFHHGTMKFFLNKEVWPCLTAQLQLLFWMEKGNKG